MTCETCQDRGWTLDDQRVQVCDCGAYDPPKWVRRGDPACIIVHVREPARPRRAARGFLCAGCADRLAWTIGELPAQYDELAELLAPSGGPSGGRVCSSGEDRLPIVVTDKAKIGPAADHRDAIAYTLASWARLTVEERAEQGSPVLVPVTPSVAHLAAFLTAYSDWLAYQPWVSDLFAEMRDLRITARWLLQPNRRRRIDIGPCGDCQGRLWLTVDVDEGRELACDTCRRSVEARNWRKERSRITGRDEDPVLTLAQAAEHYDVPLRTVQRWVADGRLPADSAGVRSSAVEAVMQELRRAC